MDLKKIISNMTREEFLELGLIERGCPWHWGIDYKCKNEICTDCWLNSLEKSGIKFKDEKSEEEKFIDALKVVKNYCNNIGDCEKSGCIFDSESGCKLLKDAPAYWNLEGLNESKS